jgi:hypothetical protein
MAYIRDYYGVPAKRGARITFCARTGTVVGSRGQYLRVRLDDSEAEITTVHPTWEVQYL